jgi:membrane protein implicated in regulation of membrane protease activity
MNATLVYAICFGVGLLFTLVSGLFGGVFGGHAHLGHGGTDGHAESGFGSNDMPGFSPLSPTTLATFLTAFGGIGLVLDKIQATASPWLSAPLAALGAFVIAAAVFFMFSAFFRKTQSSSEARVANLVGQPASVITPVPAVGLGEIAYIQGGSRYTAPARALDGKAIPTGTAVVITRIVGAEFYVQAS